MKSPFHCNQTFHHSHRGSMASASLLRTIVVCKTLLKKIDEHELYNRYTLGSHVAAALDIAEYGDNAAELFSEHLHLDKSTLTTHANVSRQWSRKDFKALSNRKGKAGFHLSWYHFVVVIRVEGYGARRSLLEFAFKNSSSGSSLRREVDRRYPLRKARSGAFNASVYLTEEETQRWLEFICHCDVKYGRARHGTHVMRSIDEFMSKQKRVLRLVRAA